MKLIFFILTTFAVMIMSACTLPKKASNPKENAHTAAPTVDTTYSDKNSYGDGIEMDDVIVMSAPPTEVKSGSHPKSAMKIRSAKKSIKKSVAAPHPVTPTGNIVYNVPDTMTYDKVETVILRITKSNEVEIVAQGMKQPEQNIIVKDIRVSPLMTAELIDPSPEKANFIIKAINTTEQNIEEQGYTQWEWTVKPVKSGSHSLKLLIKVRTDNNGLKDIPVFDKDIYVYAKPLAWGEDFWNKYWQWIISTILLPLIVYVYKKRSGKDKE